MAQFKFTVLLMPNGPLRITSSFYDPELYKSEHEVQDPELKVCTQVYCLADVSFLLDNLLDHVYLQALLQSSASRKAQKKKKKKVGSFLSK